MTNETQNTTQEKSETTAANNENGNKSEPASLIERADASRQRLAEENERLERNLKALEEIRVNELLGGRTVINAEKQEKPISEVEYAQSVIRGIIPGR